MSLLTSLLNFYSMSYEDLRRRASERSFADLKRPDPEVLKPLLGLISRAKTKKMKAVIYGDYDVDGLTSTAIVKRALDEFGIECGFFIPSRYVEGYGLNKERVRQFYYKGYSLLICVDNGISCFEEIKYAKMFGFKVIVIDHHQKQDTLPNADCIFHQDSFLDYNCSAASLAYFVASSLLKRDDEYLAFLAGLAVFSDVMPLVGNNLTFAKMALKLLNTNRYKNISMLLESYPATYDDLSFSVNSKLNAVGRVKDDSLSTNNACRFLIDKDARGNCMKEAKNIKEANEEKKNEVKDPRYDGHVFETSSFIGVRYEGKSGLTGLLANRLLEEKGKTACVFAKDPKQEGVLVASIRADSDYSLSDFFKKYKSVFITYGGHSKAMGFSVKSEDMDKVCVYLATWIMSKPFASKKEDKCIEIIREDLVPSNVSVFRNFEPFGEEFEAPVFSLTVSKEDLSLSNSGKALLVKNGGDIIAMYYKDTSVLDREFDYAVLKGKLRINSFKGRETLELVADGFSTR